MTVINLETLVPQFGGNYHAGIMATITATPWRGRAGAWHAHGDQLVLPAAITATISADGTASPELDLEPNQLSWCWKLQVRVENVRGVDRWVNIPNSGPVDWDQLVDIDPMTLQPSTSGQAAWDAAIAEVQSILDQAAVARDESEAFATDASASANAASSSETASAGSATAAAGSASAAASSATAASGSAASALASANDADADRIAAQTARGAAQVSATNAGNSATSAGNSATAASGSATAAAGSAADALLSQQSAAESANLALTGQFLGTALTASDNLNTKLTPGVYRCGNGGYATLANNYPRANLAGVLEVLQWGAAGLVLQRYTPYPTVTTSPETVLGSWVRGIRGSGVFGAWRFVPTQRVDTTAGRAIYTWDDVNNREQLVYGDTGWRTVTSDIAAGWSTANVRIRRYGIHVYFRIYRLSALSTPPVDTVLYNLPLGFQGNLDEIRHAITVPAGATYMLTTSNTRVTAPLNVSLPTGADIQLAWTTNDAWPTTLPGSASGTIPNL